MLTYADVQSYLEPKLIAAGYNPLPTFDPGPGMDAGVQDIVPDTMVIITPWPGGGLDSEQLFDMGAVQIRSIGPQWDYETAEKLAQDCDRAMIGFSLSQEVNGKWWLTVMRAGGSPALLLIDDGNRYHFYCNYIVEVEYA